MHAAVMPVAKRPTLGISPKTLSAVPATAPTVFTL